jgi:hypothetical protein
MRHLLPRMAADLRHARQVRIGWRYLSGRYTAYREADTDEVASLRAARIADEADLLIWHLDRSWLAQRWNPGAATRLRDTSNYWRFQARRWAVMARQEANVR